MVNPILNKQLPVQTISANPLGEQKIAVAPPQQQPLTAPGSISFPKLNVPQKDTLDLSKKFELPKPAVKTEIQKTSPKDETPVEPTGLQVKNPMNVGLVKPGIPSSYAEGRTPEPNLDPQMLAQAGIDPSDPKQLAALGLSPEQMKQVATSVTSMAKTGKAGAMAVWQAVGVGAVALGGLALVATKKGQVIAKQFIQMVKDKGIVGDVVANSEKAYKSVKAQACSFVGNLTKWNSDVVVYDGVGKLANQSVKNYLDDLTNLAVKNSVALDSSHFRPINLRFFSGAGAVEKEKALIDTWKISEHFSSLEDMTPRIKVTMEGFAKETEILIKNILNKSENITEVSDAFKIWTQKNNGRSLLDHVQSIQLTALDSNDLAWGFLKKNNRIDVNMGSHILVDERQNLLTSFVRFLGF